MSIIFRADGLNKLLRNVQMETRPAEASVILIITLI
jgi:hypothetical protein